MREILIQLVTAFLGSLGFSILFGLRRRYLFAASLGGLLVWGVYLIMEGLLQTPFLSNLLAAAFAVLYAEALARILKSPATLFVVPGIVPLAPGSSLYYTMSSAVGEDLALTRVYGMQTLKAALAIAAGISFVLALRELRTKKQ